MNKRERDRLFREYSQRGHLDLVYVLLDAEEALERRSREITKLRREVAKLRDQGRRRP